MTNLARRLAERSGESEKALLARQESAMERSRLAREDLCVTSPSPKQKGDGFELIGLRKQSTGKVLTDLSPEHGTLSHLPRLTTRLHDRLAFV